jgi:hypothetical protein
VRKNQLRIGNNEKMNKRKPYKQRWRGGEPTENEIKKGIVGFTKNAFARITQLADTCDLLPLFVGPRTDDASTIPRCYLFYNETCYQKGYENLACIDQPSTSCRLIVRPFGRGKDRTTLLPHRFVSQFKESDLSDWRQINLRTPNDWGIATEVMREIRISYAEIFDVD